MHYEPCTMVMGRYGTGKIFAVPTGLIVKSHSLGVSFLRLHAPYGVHTALSMASYITVWAGCSTESHSIKVTSTLAPVGV